MKTFRALTLVWLASAPLARAASGPTAELRTNATPTDVAVRGARQAHYRLAPGETLMLRVTGPAPVRFEVRVENGPPAEPVVATLELDDEFTATPAISPAVEPEAISSSGLSTSQTVSLAVSVPAGKHSVGLRWPAGASAAALVAIQGVDVKAAPRRKADGPAAAVLLLPPLDLPGTATPEALDAQKTVEPSTAAAPSTTGEKPQVLAAISQRAAAPGVGFAVGPVAEMGPPSPGPEAWTFTFLAGAERGTEKFAEASTLAHLGLEATRTAWVTAFVVFQLDWRVSRQTYLIGQPSAGASSDASRVDEQRWDALLGIGYDLGPLLQTPRLVLAPIVGLKYLRLQNSAFPADLFGVDLGGWARYSLSNAVGVHASAGWIYNLLHRSFFSAVGAPLGQFGVKAGLDFPLAGRYALALDYQSDVLAFDFSYRVAHGATVSFGRSF